MPSHKGKPSKVNLVFIYSDQEFSDIFKRMVANQHKILDTYDTVGGFLENIGKYPKDINVLFGNKFEEEKLIGVEVAERLHELGFRNLYLFTGTDYTNDRSTLPMYLTPILKTRIDLITKLLEFPNPTVH